MEGLVKSEESGKASMPSLEPCTNHRISFLSCDKEKVDELVLAVDGLGEILDGATSAADSTIEGEGLIRCSYDEVEAVQNRLKVTAYVSKGKRNVLGVDTIHLTVDHSLWRHDPTAKESNRVEVENPIDYHVTPHDVERGVYDIRYRLKVKPEGGHVPLLVMLNGERVGGKVYNIPIEPAIKPKLVMGDKMIISYDSMSGQITADGGWCRVDVPLNKIRGQLNLRVTGGNGNGWYSMRIYPGASSPTPTSGNTSDGAYNWCLGNIYYMGTQIKSGGGSVSSGVFGFSFSSTGINVYKDSVLLYTFTEGFDPTKEYYLYPQGFYNGSSVTIVP
jgi:hypothetical protein